MKKILQKVVMFCMTYVVCSFYAFAGGRSEEQIPEGKIAVAVTFDAMKELTQVVGRDKVYIHTIIPPGVEAHDFEPKVGNLAFLKQAKAIVYNGLGMEHWLGKVLEAGQNPNLRTICVTRGIEPIRVAGFEDGHEGCDGSCGHDHGEYDPHAWLSLNAAKVMVYNISRGLSEIDPANRDFYESNAAAFIKEADSLLSDYQQKFALTERKNFVTSHAAFSYFCRDFGLHQKGALDVFAAHEPTAQQLARLTDFCKEQHVTTIFAEKIANREVAQTLAKEAGTAVKTIYTIETAEDGLSYLDRMTYNLKNIYESLIR